jgi:hypothetical protein
LGRQFEIERHEQGFPEIEATALAKRGSVKRLSLLALFATVFALASCHSAATSTAVTCTTTAATTSSASSSVACTDPTTNISVTISPATISVNVVTTTRFFASVSGGTNSIITWEVNGIAAGNDTVGRIDSSGVYHAPAIPPSPATVTVSATSFEDPIVTAGSSVTITPPPVVTISPTAWTLPAGTANSKQFAATVVGAPTTNVDWYVATAGTNPIQGGNDILGTVDANGVYTAPRTPPLGSNIIVSAVSRDFTLSAAGAAVAVSGYSTSSLQGRFAFSMSGNVAGNAFFRAGTFSADGLGGLSSGLEDINESTGVTPSLSFTGNYSVAPDGRGTLVFSDGHIPGKFNFVFVNDNQLQVIGFDGFGTAAGRADAQDAATFGPSALLGTYVFDFAGVQGANELSQIGEFAADGNGHVTSGAMDANAGGIASQAAISGGTYTVDATTGRGTATLVTSGTPLTFGFYIVTRGSAKFVGMDPTPRVAGITSQQAPNTTFNVSSLNGSFAFLLSNSRSKGNYASAGSFVANGAGGISSGVLDENLSGTPNANFAFSGAYTVAANGRGTATFTGARAYVFYLGAPGSAFFQETDSLHPNVASNGFLAQQQVTAFSQSLLTGNYSISSSGLSGSSIETFTGEMAANGAGVIETGIIDVNVGGTPTSAQSLTGVYAASSSAERGTLTLTLPAPLNETRTFAVYTINPPQTLPLPVQQIILIGIDTGRTAGGSLFLQY